MTSGPSQPNHISFYLIDVYQRGRPQADSGQKYDMWWLHVMIPALRPEYGSALLFTVTQPWKPITCRYYSYRYLQATYIRASFLWQVFLFGENVPVCTGPLVKFSLVESHLLESWRASFSTCLTNENLVCVHTGESRRQVRREKLVKENLSYRLL